MQRTVHIEVEIRLLATANGGRTKPALSGYRPQFAYDGADWDAVYEFPDVDKVEPGETATALLSFLSPESHRGRVHVGMPFDIREGQRVVGSGTVTAVREL